MEKGNTGFTLLEMIAALGVFSVVIIIFSSTFLSLLNAERRAQASAGVQDNVRFALEVMSKEIRTGTNYNYVAGQPNTSLFFLNAKNQTITYRLSEAGDGQCAANRCIGKIIACVDGQPRGCGSFLPLTSDQILVDNLRFYLAGIQPRIQIVVNGSAKIQNVETKLNVQTTVSQRKVIQQP